MKADLNAFLFRRWVKRTLISLAILAAVYFVFALALWYGPAIREGMGW